MFSKYLVSASVFASVIGLSLLVAPSSDARPGPTRSRRAKAAANTASFAGHRTISKSAAAAPSFVGSVGGNPTPLPLPTPKTPTQDPTLPSALTQPKAVGPMAGPVPSPEQPAKPSEFLWVPPQRLAHVMGKLRVESAKFLSFTEDGMTMSSSQTATLRVEHAPPGKVAFVRCGVDISTDKQPFTFYAQTKTGKKTQVLSKGGGLLELEVFGGKSFDLVTLGIEPKSAAKGPKVLKWTLTGCDRTVH